MNWHKNFFLFRFPCLVLSFLSAIIRCFITQLRNSYTRTCCYSRDALQYPQLCSSIIIYHAAIFGLPALSLAYVSSEKHFDTRENEIIDQSVRWLYLRNRKHVPCFYRVIQTRVEVWANEKCCRNTSHGQCFHSFFEFSQTFTSVSISH